MSFVKFAALMFRDGVIRHDSISAFLEHAVHEAANIYQYSLVV